MGLQVWQRDMSCPCRAVLSITFEGRGNDKVCHLLFCCKGRMPCIVVATGSAWFAAGLKSWYAESYFADKMVVLTGASCC
jgi:hypothetical protein